MEKLRKILAEIGEIDPSMLESTQKRLDNLTKPQGSLGQLEDLAKQISGITNNKNPRLKNKVTFVMAGDHGITENNVSAFPKEVTPQMVLNFLAGGAGINVLSRHVNSRVVVTDIGIARDLTPHPKLKIKKIGYGTQNMSKGPAMTRSQAIGSIETGIEVFEEEYGKGIDLVGTGDMGIGNTTPSSAITSVITGMPVEKVTGRGTGINDKYFMHKIELIKKSIGVNSPDATDALDVLAKVGGFEIGGLAGIILAAASKRKPVVIDGFISGAAALISCTLEPKVKDFLIAGHCSVESGHIHILNHIGLKPILDLNLRLGEGTGAVLAMQIVEASVKILNEMATFESAAVSSKAADLEGAQEKTPA